MVDRQLIRIPALNMELNRSIRNANTYEDSRILYFLFF